MRYVRYNRSFGSDERLTLRKVSEDEVDRMWRINVKPIYHSAKTCVEYWKRKGREGQFINLSSISAPRPRPGLVWYAASKAAVTAVSLLLSSPFPPSPSLHQDRN